MSAGPSLMRSSKSRSTTPIYSHFDQITIHDLLRFVNRQTGCLKAIDHLLDRYVKSRTDYQRIIAVIVAYVTNNGLYKMANISDIKYAELEAASNFIRSGNDSCNLGPNGI